MSNFTNVFSCTSYSDGIKRIVFLVQYNSNEKPIEVASVFMTAANAATLAEIILRQPTPDMAANTAGMMPQ